MAKIHAAGAVLFDRSGKAPKVAMIHRPRYDDWSLPKGKLEKGELAPVAAVREVREETGFDVRLGAPLGRISYPLDGGDKKLVDFWCATITGGGHTPDDEADQLAWLTLGRAAKRASSKDYADLIEVAKHCYETTPVIIVRHAKARERKKWAGPDIERPLNARGRRQLTQLTPLLQAYGVRRVVSSPATRCVETVRPYVERYRPDVATEMNLSEEVGCRDERAVTQVVKRIAADAGRSGVPTAVSGHRPLLPAMLRGLGLAPRSFATGDCLVVHVDRHGKPRIDEFYANPQ